MGKLLAIRKKEKLEETDRASSKKKEEKPKQYFNSKWADRIAYRGGPPSDHIKNTHIYHGISTER